MSKIQNPKSKIRIAVIGPGGIGCLFSGLLAEAGHEVYLVDRRPERSALISRDGLILEQDGAGRTVALQAHAFPSDIEPVELIILCVKAHETAGTIRSILTLSLPDTIVLSLQNGLGNLEALESVVKGTNLFAGITTCGATVVALNLVRQAGTGATVVGSLHQNNEGAERLAQILSKSGIETSSTENTIGMLWSKLIINAAICPVSVMADLPNGELALSEKWRSLLIASAKEGARVAAARGIKLMYADPARAVLEVCQKTSENISSMLQDTRRGRNTEIMQINGAIIRAAAELGIDTPINAMLCQSVLDRERHSNRIPSIQRN